MRTTFLIIIIISLTLPLLTWAKPKPPVEIAFLTFPNDPEHSELVRLGFKALEKPEKSGTTIRSWTVMHPRIMGRSKSPQQL